MPITEISIENFKGIGSRQTIPLRPITLLFGGNSAGKSTILQALHLFKEVLKTGSSDVDKLIPGTPGLDIGGFDQYVHNHDLDKKVRISLTMEVDDDGLPDYHTADPIDVAIDVSTVGIEIEVSWDRTRDRSFVSRLTSYVDGSVFAITTKDESDALTTLGDIRTSAPGITSAIEELFPDDHDHGGALARLTQDYPNPKYLEYLEDREREYLDEELADDAPMDLDRGDNMTSEDIPLPLEIYLRDKPIIPEPRVGFLCDSDDELLEGLEDGAITNWLLTRIITGSTDLLREELEGTRYIGSLRTIPERGYRGQASISPDRWANGLAAWDLLFRARKITDWLNLDSINSLELGCQLSEFPEKPVIDHEQIDKFSEWLAELVNQKMADITKKLTTAQKLALAARDSSEGPLIDTESLLEDLVKSEPRLSPKKNIHLTTSDGKTRVEPCDVGVGVSQVIPVVIGAMEPDHKILMVEQPELHIHPRVQCALGDILARQAVKNPSKIQLLETHSEHLVLRFLRRIRELHENELPEGAPKLTPAHLSVLYVNQTDNGVEVTQLPVTEDGDFGEEWPSGFFEERFDEYEM